MNNTVNYKGYTGSVEFSEEDKLFYGKVQGIRVLISYVGSDARELMQDFRSSVDHYLESCEKQETGECPFTEECQVKLPMELQQQAQLYADTHNESLNQVVRKALAHYLSAE